jgi:hypothetical protein
MPNNNIVEMTVDGGISAVEFDDIVGKIEAAIEKHGNVRLLKHIRSLGAVPVSKFWDDIKFGFENMKHFSHAAVVADQKWIEVFTKMAKPFISAEVRYFNEAEIDQARQWLRRDTTAGAT